MAVLYNNRVCVSANELIKLYATKGSEKGFLTYDQYRYKTASRKLTVVRSHGRGQSALVEWETMEDEVKERYVAIYGDPTDEVERTRQSVLLDAMKYNEEAYSFFSSLKDDNGRRLPAEKVDLYTLQARVLDAVIVLRDARRSLIGGGKSCGRDYRSWSTTLLGCVTAEVDASMNTNYRQRQELYDAR